jgi:murein DD-endopeptidase MepM/ murein hydrolase activator NlpD
MGFLLSLILFLVSGHVPIGVDSARFRVPRDSVGGFVWPVGSPRVVRRFAPPPEPWLAGHRGVDLAVPPGAVVRSAGAGTVVFAGVIAGRGVVSVAHAGGLRTTYEPIESDLRAGESVTAGEPIGTLAAGHPGCAYPACLHWGLRRGEQYLDPLALLGLGRVRLLPLQRAQQRGQAFGQPVVLVRTVVDLRAQPQPATTAPGVDRGLGRELVRDVLA